MDIKAKAEEIIGKIQSDKDLGAKFEANPTAAIEGLIGVDLPDDQLNGIVTAVKAKLGADKLSGALGGLLGGK